jgi:hypothetical protein
MALPGLRVTPDAEPVLRRKGQGTLPPRRGKKEFLESSNHRGDSMLIKLLSNNQKKSSAALTASRRRYFIVRASGDRYQTSAKPPIAPIVPTASRVAGPH